MTRSLNDPWRDPTPEMIQQCPDRNLAATLRWLVDNVGELLERIAALETTQHDR